MEITTQLLNTINALNKFAKQDIRTAKKSKENDVIITDTKLGNIILTFYPHSERFNVVSFNDMSVKHTGYITEKEMIDFLICTYSVES